MRMRRLIAYLGLLIGLVLLVWTSLSYYPVYSTAAGVTQQTTNVNGFGIVREAARDGLVRDEQGRLVKRLQRAKADGKDDKTCPT